MTQTLVFCILAMLGFGLLGLRFLALRRDLAKARANIADLNEKRLTERAESAFYRIACSNTDDGLVVQNLQGKVLWVNPAYCRIMGYAAHEVLGRNPMEYCLPPDKKPSDQAIRDFEYKRDDPNWGRLSLYRNLRKNGEAFWNQIRVSYHLEDDGSEYIILVCRDVSKEVDREERLREKSAELAHVASHDVLTGVANRAQLSHFVTQALADARTNKSNVGLLQIDLDKFKLINDTYGHSAGDAVLKHVCNRISQTLRKTDLLARLGGDEFVAVCPDVNSIDALQKLGASLCDCIRTPLHFEGQEIVPQISVGAAASEAGETDLEELLKKSDLALYEVKRNGRGYVAVYDHKLHHAFERRSRRADDFQRAVTEKQINFRFQPVVDVASGTILGFETLARWQHPIDGLQLPATFLPLARDLGLMADIDRLAFQAALALQSKLKAAGWPQIETSFNASAEFIDKPEIQRLMRKLPAQLGIDPNKIIIEIPEMVLLDQAVSDGEPPKSIAAIRALGYQIVVDRFAAGFAGLLNLGKLNVTGFKADLSLSADLTTNPASLKTIAMVQTLASDMGAHCITLGIETEAQFNALQSVPGLAAQGNWIAPPMAAADVPAWLFRQQNGTGQPQIALPQLPPLQRIAI